MQKKIGVLFSGLGHLDGAEIRESVLTLLALDELLENRPSFKVVMMAPDHKQHHVINHLTQETDDSSKERNILLESARLARGQISSVEEVNKDLHEFSALFIPGGFGVAKNLCTFAFKGHKGEVRDDVRELITKMHAKRAPIGALCIAPALVALVLGKNHVELTVGNDKEVAQEIEKLGCKHIEKSADEYHFDKNNLIGSTPAYMYGDAKLHTINRGVFQMVSKILDLV